MRFGESTFLEIRNCAESEALAVVPTGCTEQQGPHLALHYLFSFGPMIASIVVTGWLGGTVGLRELWGRVTRWRVGWRWFAISTLSPVALFIVAALVAWGVTARFFYAGSKAAIEKRIDETLELVGLANKADRPIKGFSGGEHQRLGIAQAQINYPDLLILDEPAASLDPQGRHDVLEVMERLRKHTTIFYSTHILADVQRVSDTVAILDHGGAVGISAGL